jgi:predicted nucleic acid-binding protein
MNDLVIDASAMVHALTTTTPQASTIRDRIQLSVCHAPHLIDAEVGDVLRRQERAGELTTDDALTALLSMRHFIDNRYPATGPLAEAAWRLRGAITFHDALYVALASTLGATLVTSDARLSRAPGLPCEVELVKLV